MSKTKYINVPFSPLFVAAFMKETNPALAVEVVHHVSQKAIDHFMDFPPGEALSEDKDQINRDLPRTAWLINGQELSLTDGVTSSGCLEALQQQTKGSVNLTEKEVKALYTMACTDGTSALQGGFFRGSYSALLAFLIYSDFPIGGFDSPCEIERVMEGSLNILHAGIARELPTGEYSEEGFIKYAFQFNVSETDDGYVVSADKDHYEVQFRRDIWEKNILGSAWEKLSNQGRLKPADLVGMIPCLCDTEFSASFISRLSRESDEVQRSANEWIRLCFEGRQQDYKRILQQLEQQQLLEEKVFNELQGECNRYKEYLISEAKATDDKKLPELIRLIEILNNSKDNRAVRIKKFTESFGSMQETFKGDSRGMIFVKNILHILATIVTLGIYAIYRAQRSYAATGSPKFWAQDKDGQFKRKVNDGVKKPSKKK